jgi:hypothetical protein
MRFIPTFDSDSIRDFMPAHPVLLPASSWARQPRKANGALLVPCIPSQVPEIAADSGGFAASLRAAQLGLEDGYSYTSEHYVTWLQGLGSRLSWAATFDYPCAGANAQVVRVRQERTTAMAWLFWSRYQQITVWVPTIQGHTPAEYRSHAQELRPLLDEMACYYGKTSAWRVGIGGLVRRPVETICQICRAVADALPDISLHAWGVSLRTLYSPLALPRQVISFDSSSWARVQDSDRAAWYASGLRQRQWTITVALPRYLAAIEHAWASPKQLALQLST